MRILSLMSGVVMSIFITAPILSQAPTDYLANNTVLIIRHAEKPLSGTGLSSKGEARAAMYARYFEPFEEDGMSFKVDCLYAGADSEKSFRPRLTLERLSATTGMPLHHEIGTKDTAMLVQELRGQNHGLHPLVSWRHSEIPALLLAFGASPHKLLPSGKWPDEVFDWVIILKMGANGEVMSSKLVPEHLEVTER